MLVRSFLADQLMSDVINWNAARSILQAHPGAVSSIGFPHGFTVLHFAINKKAPLSFVRLLVRQHPNAIRKTDNNGCLPLHVACGNKQSLEVIQFLVQQSLVHSRGKTARAISLCTLHAASNTNNRCTRTHLATLQY